MKNKAYPRIIFLGTPDFAVASLKALVEDNWNVIAVVTAPDKPAGRGRQLKSSAVKEYAESQNIPVLQPEKLKNEAFLGTLASYKADVQIVVAFRMLPEVVWNMPPMGTINVHGSLLPDYRGAAPINWAIINGETVTGVTTFKLKHDIDTGNILLQKSIPILPSDNMGTMYEKLMQLGANLLIETLEGVVANNITEIPQKINDNYHHAPKIFKEDCLIDWNNQGKAIINKIRGLAPLPTAFSQLKNKTLKIYEAFFENENHEKEMGFVSSDQKTFLKFACKDGWINVLDIQLEGKKRMEIKDFLRGYQI